MKEYKKRKILKGSGYVLILLVVIGGFVFVGKTMYKKGLTDCEKAIQEVPEHILIEQEEQRNTLSLIHTYLRDESYTSAIQTFKKLITMCSLLDVEIDDSAEAYIFFNYRRREIATRFSTYEIQESTFERAIREFYESAPIFLTTVDENERIHYRIYFNYKFSFGDQPINQIERICVDILFICRNEGIKVQLQGNEYVMREDTPEPIIFYELNITTTPYDRTYLSEDKWQEIRVLFHKLLYYARGGGSFGVHYNSDGEIDDICFRGKFDTSLCLQYMDFR